LYEQYSQDTQLAATLTVLELPNLLGALELLQASAGAEEVVELAISIEGLLQYLGRPRAMARVVRVREAASKGLGEWTRGRFHAESAAVDRLLEAGRFAEAVQAARAVLQRSSAAGEGAYEGASYQLAEAHFRLGRALRMGGAAEAALGPLAEARKRFQKLGDASNRRAARMAMKSLTETGDCLRDLGRLDEAAAAYEESIRLAEALDDRRGGAAARGQLGTVRMLQQRYDDALSAWNEARKTFEQIGEHGTVAAAWHQIGWVYQEAGQREAAEHAYQQALKIKVQRSDRSGEAGTLNQLGQLYRSMGRSEDAVRFYRQATATYTEIGDLKNEGSARSNVAIVLIQLQRYDEARQEILRAIECKKPYGHAAQPWTTFALLHDLERAVGNASAAADARADAGAAFLAYRRAGGENHEPGARLAAAVGQAVTSGETADVASQLAELGARPDLHDYLKALVPVLQRIVDGSRDPALASTAGLDYDDAVEVGLLLERLG
jgi:tetratricopeptide (TPR) repeat protein